MQIITNFKDYYDHIGQVYGGGDPLHKYIRKPISELCQLQIIKVSDDLSASFLSAFEFQKRAMANIQFKIICCAGKTYILSKPENSSNGFALFKASDYQNSPTRLGRFFSADRTAKKLESYQGKEFDFALMLSKNIATPVFSVQYVSHEKDKKWKFLIEKNIPILKDLSFPSFISAEQMYQELSQFISSKMKDNPDTYIPDASSDKEKILQHGFDMEKSFRHRK